MEATGLLILAILILLWLCRSRQSSGQEARRDMSGQEYDEWLSQENSHVSYWHDGELVHESEACAGCIANRAQDLESQGYEVERVVLGRRHSGDLIW